MTTIYEVHDFQGRRRYCGSLAYAQGEVLDDADGVEYGDATISALELPRLSKTSVLAILNDGVLRVCRVALVETYTLTTTDGVKKLSVTTERTVGDG